MSHLLVVTRAIEDAQLNGRPPAPVLAPAILEALTAAGFRIVGPGEVDLYLVKNKHGEVVRAAKTQDEALEADGGLWEGDYIVPVFYATPAKSLQERET